jgi:hypothetical protein
LLFDNCAIRQERVIKQFERGNAAISLNNNVAAKAGPTNNPDRLAGANAALRKYVFCEVD